MSDESVSRPQSTAGIESASAYDETVLARIRQRELDDYRWAFDAEMHRSERLDTLAVALLASAVPTGALVANALKDRHLNGSGHALLVLFIAALLGCTALAVWERASYLIWTPGHRMSRSAASASPAQHVVTRWQEAAAQRPADLERVETQEIAGWQERLHSAEANAHTKSLLAAGAMACLLIVAIDLPLLLIVGT